MTKDYKVYLDKTSLYKIKFEGGGEIHKSLSGQYTSYKEANTAIQNYEQSKTRNKGNRGVKNASLQNTD